LTNVLEIAHQVVAPENGAFNRQRKIMPKKKIHCAGTTARYWFTGAILALMVPAWAGCAATYGSLQSSREVTEAFNNSQILADHQYYYSGFERIPYGLIGIDNRYRLRSRYWQTINPDATLLGQWVYRMQHVYSLPPRGAWIMDQNGNRIGVWFSSQYYTTVKLETENEIVVFPPKPPELSGIP
jgi:hypothetical protein